MRPAAHTRSRSAIRSTRRCSPTTPGIGEQARAHLAGRYGLFAERVLAICAEDPDLCRPIVEGMPDLLVEAVVAARHEQARTVADVLLRRTRLGLLAGRRTIEDPDTALRVAKAMGAERGWGRREVKRAAEAWPEAVRAERLTSAERPAAASWWRPLRDEEALREEQVVVRGRVRPSAPPSHTWMRPERPDGALALLDAARA